VSSVAQLQENLATLNNLDFSADELMEIDQYATESGVNFCVESTSA
jgi:L-glyceraldehyde 3-phosphate reductase